MEPKVEPVGPPAVVGEGPFWDDETQTLYYIDAFRPRIYSYHPSTGSHNSVSVVSEKPGKPEVHTSFVIKIKGEKNKFVISDDKRLAVINWDGVSSDPVMTEHLMDVEQEPVASFNDGKCDPSNRLWAGTRGSVPLDVPITEMQKEKGSLYSLQRDKTVKKHLSKITLSNGLTWSLDKKKFYYIDSLKFGIDSYDYDDTTGSISNGKTVFCYKKNNVDGLPDGMTTDQEGKIWVACVRGGQVLRIDPNTGEIIQTVKIPSPLPTSVVFGGPNYEDLYVTSGKIKFTKEMEEKYPMAGCTFRVTGLGVRGVPSLPVQL
uniref:Regucalcin n=1 Tax=Cuerna arida TaxID=1464854 RepID=A0A1B6EIG4_9HEMI